MTLIIGLVELIEQRTRVAVAGSGIINARNSSGKRRTRTCAGSRTTQKHDPIKGMSEIQARSSSAAARPEQKGRDADTDAGEPDQSCRDVPIQRLMAAAMTATAGRVRSDAGPSAVLRRPPGSQIVVSASRTNVQHLNRHQVHAIGPPRTLPMSGTVQRPASPPV